MVRQTPDAIDAPFRRDEPYARVCQHSGCPAEGLYRAPKSRNRLTEYYWFCLDHVREYNQAWNYFVGMNEEEIEGQRRVDTVWERPSWPLSGRYHEAERRIREKVYRTFGVGDEGGRREEPPRTEDEKALAVLGLERPVAFPDVKARYKALVKQLHPDANGGDPEAEEQMKVVNDAYNTLKRSFVQ